MGLKRIFDGHLADFSSGVSDMKGSLEVGLFEHSACLEITELGTGAATAMGI